MSGMPLVVATFVFLFLMGIFQGMQRVAFCPGHGQGHSHLSPRPSAGMAAIWSAERSPRCCPTCREISHTAQCLRQRICHDILAAFALTSLGLLALQFGMVEPRAPTVRIEEPFAAFAPVPGFAGGPGLSQFVVAQDSQFVLAFQPLLHSLCPKLMPLSGETIGTLSLAYLWSRLRSQTSYGGIWVTSTVTGYHSSECSCSGHVR